MNSDRRLLDLIDAFLSGNTGLMAAREIEELIVDNYTDEPWYDDALYALSVYSPGGGDFLMAEADLVPVLRDAGNAIRARGVH